MNNKIAILESVPLYKDLALNQTKALVFDMDGTLLNSEILHAKALKDLLKNSDEDFSVLLEQMTGMAEPDCYMLLKDKKLISDKYTFDDFIYYKNELFKSYLKEERINKSLIHIEILDLISMAKINNIKIALVTASEKSTTELFLNSLNIKQEFDLIISRGDTLKSKPNPEPYFLCFSKLNVNANEVIIFEDSPTGLKAASESKAPFYQVRWYY